MMKLFIGLYRCSEMIGGKFFVCVIARDKEAAEKHLNDILGMKSLIGIYHPHEIDHAQIKYAGVLVYADARGSE